MKLSFVAGIAAATLCAAAPATAQDWTGFYAGVSAGRTSADWAHYSGASGSLNNSGAYSNDRIAGAFFGYSQQQGNLVYGGELALGRTNGLCFADYPAECTDNFVDLKGRIGFAAGSALVYGVLGMSKAEYDYVGTDYSLTGLAYGVGVDYAFGGKFFAGGEVLRRNLENDNFDGGDRTEHDFTSVSLRVGMKF